MIRIKNRSQQPTTRIRRGPSPALLVSFVALFVALSGAAVALPGKETVNSGDIVNESIKSADLKNDTAVKTADVVDETLTSDDLAPASVAASELGDGIEPRTNSVVVGGGTGQNATYIYQRVTASCLAGEELISGSGHWANDGINDELALSEVELDHNAETVTVKGGNDQGANRALVAVAHCL
jgi:hypothetical protein